MSVTAQCTPLFQAVEQQGGQEGYSTCTSSLVALLLHSKQRSSILDTIKSKSFHKNHARRLFSALSPILQHIVENEEFIPASACHDEEERRISNSNSHSNSEEDLERSSSGAPSHNNRASNASNVTVTPDEESTKALLFIKYTAMMVHAYLVNLSSKHEDTNNNNNNNSDNNSHKQRSYEIMEEVKEITELLHDVLFDLNSCGVEGLNVQKSIVALCESYWNGHFINRNDYVASVIPLLVVRTLDGNATKADIKRLWNMRDALPLFSFQDESIAYLRSLMVRAVGSGLFIKNAEGRKMISYFFQLDGGLVKDLHEAIKAQIPLAKKSDLLIYGEIYSRAWKEAHADAAGEKEEGEEEDIDDDESFASSSIQATIEDALQELMNASVHVASPHMATSLQSVLDPLLVQKKNPEVDILIYKMYTPFLWRSLSAANPLVRVNASSALSKTFPLRDPNAGKLHLKEVHVKTIDSLLSLLRDEDHKVRVAGCDATIQILGFWWDSLSSTHIRALLNEIVMKHANDATSSAVRAQAVNGISQLLDAKASHGVLRALLPYLGDLIHDRVEKVRLATARLLIKLKTTKNFKFFHTVPKEHLLARLAAEGEGVKVPTGPLAFALSDLLSNSYYPKKAEVSEVVRRTVGFLEENPKAARVFYSNVAYHLEIKSVCKLVKLLLNCVEIGVTREVKKEERSKKRRRNDGSDEDDDGEGEGKSSDYDDLIPTITASNTGLMAEMAATILTLLNSVSRNPGFYHCFQSVQ
jgi:condensin-2 complex subunit G2